MDLDRVETRSVVFGAEVDMDIPQGEIAVTNFIPTLNTALTAHEEYVQDIHPELASPAITQLILSHAFSGWQTDCGSRRSDQRGCLRNESGPERRAHHSLQASKDYLPIDAPHLTPFRMTMRS